jgi:hypothetical protein
MHAMETGADETANAAARTEKNSAELMGEMICDLR